MPTLGKTIFELTRIFRLLNEKYYDGELQTPVIAVQTQGKINALGWCTTRKIWKHAKEADRTYYEITLTAEYLTSSNEEIVNTMLHEMAHLYCNQHGIKDCSRSGTYHNTKFKEVADAHGLCTSFHDKYGWCQTEVSLETLVYIPTLKINRQAFIIVRQGTPPKGKGKAKQSMRKYICPDCGVTVRATKVVNIMCCDCFKPMYTEDTATEETRLASF